MICEALCSLWDSFISESTLAQTWVQTAKRVGCRRYSEGGLQVAEAAPKVSSVLVGDMVNQCISAGQAPGETLALVHHPLKSMTKFPLTSVVQLLTLAVRKAAFL